MKKNLFALGVALASAFTLTNCTEEIQTAPEVENTPYTIYADAAETKTANDGLSTVWVAGDALNVFHAPAGSSEYGANTEFTLSDAEKGILFEYSELTKRTVRIVESNRYEFDEFADDKTGTVKL